MTQITISITDSAYVPNIRKILRALPWVSKIKVSDDATGNTPNATTVAAIEAADRGELRSFSCMEEFKDYVRNL